MVILTVFKRNFKAILTESQRLIQFSGFIESPQMHPASFPWLVYYSQIIAIEGHLRELTRAPNKVYCIVAAHKKYIDNSYIVVKWGI